MGGWGPFTVREIEGLFADHGFDQTTEVEPEQGVRRTAAAERLAAVDWSVPDEQQRLLALVDDVLEFYPDAESGSALSPGRRLRRALARVRGSTLATGPGESA